MTRAGSRARSPSPPLPGRLPRGLVLAVFLLRVWTGLFFLDAAKWKLVDFPREQGLSFAEALESFVAEDYVPLCEAAIADPPRLEVPGVVDVRLTFFSDFLRDVMLPAKDVVGPAILFFEVLLGLSLSLGLGTRLFAALGFAMMVVFTMAKRVYLFTVKSGNWPVTLILLALLLAAAGRYLGLDGLLRRRWPRWLAWIG